MAHRVLLVVTSDVGAEAAERFAGTFAEGTEVRVLAPASKLSRVDWLTNAEDDARAEAAERADTVAERLDERTRSATEIDAAVGDSDPLLAIGDALRTFPAEEIVVVSTRAGGEPWLEHDLVQVARARFGVPLSHHVLA
jgi:hypothetical protein